MNNFLQRHADKIAGTISSYDRVIIAGTIPGICYNAGMAAHLRHLGIRLFDYTQWANPLRQRVWDNAERLSRDNNIPLSDARKRNTRKEDVVAKILEKRGHHPGLVAILWTMESCLSFKPWYDKQTRATALHYERAQCKHYYFYFIDETLGLCHLRVPTWAPFPLQFYFNGHNWLASSMRKAGVEFQTLDNAFVSIADFPKAQRLADALNPKTLHRILDKAARRYCPVVADFPQGVHWSLRQAEYATDIIFKDPAGLAPVYEELTRTAIHSVKPENIATFLGRKLTGACRDEIGNNFNTRIEGTCIKHHMGKVAIKSYDKFHQVLRIETTCNDVSFFKHYREVVHRDGTREKTHAPMRKHIYSFGPLREALAAANARYLDFLAAVDDPSASLKDLDRLTRTVRDNGRGFAGFDLFQGDDADVLRATLNGGFLISGFRHRDLRQRLTGKTPAQLGHVLRRLRKHGLIKKIGRTFKYYVTAWGQRAGLMALKLKEMFLIPALRGIVLKTT